MAIKDDNTGEGRDARDDSAGEGGDTQTIVLVRMGILMTRNTMMMTSIFMRLLSPVTKEN